MGFKIIGKDPTVNHSCDVPRVPLFGKKNRDWRGVTVQCDCGKMWQYNFTWDSGGGAWSWSWIN